MQTTEQEAEVNKLIRDRKSIRAFSSKALSQEVVTSLFEAARWAPSSMNEQPWRYIYAHRSQPLWEKIFEALMEGNQIWMDQVPLLIVSFARKRLEKNEKVNGYAKHDLGSANGFMSLQAVELGLQIHQMGGYHADILCKNLNISDDYELGSVIAVGYPGEVNTLTPELQEREQAPRKRRKQEEFVFNKSL